MTCNSDAWVVVGEVGTVQVLGHPRLTDFAWSNPVPEVHEGDRRLMK